MAARKKPNRAKRYGAKDKSHALSVLRKHSYSATSEMTGITITTLRAWAIEAGITPPDGRSRSQPPPAASPVNGSNGHAKAKAPRSVDLELRGLKDFLREQVRRELPGVLRAELAAERKASLR